MKFISKENNKELITSVIQSSIQRKIIRINIPINIKKILEFQLRYQSQTDDKINLFSIILNLISKQKQNFNFENYLGYFFKNNYYFDEVNDLNIILSAVVNERSGLEINMYYLLILNYIGLYSFLCLNHWPPDIAKQKKKRIKTILVDLTKASEGNIVSETAYIIYETRNLLNKKRFSFHVNDLKFNVFFNKFINMFNNQNCHNMFKNSKGKNYLSNMNDKNFTDNNVIIKKKIHFRIKKKLSLFIPLIKENINMYKKVFNFVLIIRDFTNKIAYSKNSFLKAKQMSLNSGDRIENDYKLVMNIKGKNNSNEENKEISDIKRFLENNNEPGGLSFISQLACRIIQNSKKSRKRINLMIMMFGILFNRKALKTIFRMLDSFNPKSNIIHNLCLFIEGKKIRPEDLFVKNEIENLIISFCLIHFEFIAQELSTVQFLNFLENMKKIITNYYRKSYISEFLLFKEGSEKIKDWRESSILRESFESNNTYRIIKKNFKVWINVLKSAINLGGKLILI